MFGFIPDDVPRVLSFRAHPRQHHASEPQGVEAGSVVGRRGADMSEYGEKGGDYGEG